MWDLVGRRVGR